ncbi:hypothetical protein BURMUCGD1_2775 [Burkholderia multivorans CGD1]|nr:hypothetical protein BURMUCGD1_2775 [Burkholderia multivorans CGD1]
MIHECLLCRGSARARAGIVRGGRRTTPAACRADRVRGGRPSEKTGPASTRFRPILRWNACCGRRRGLR